MTWNREFITRMMSSVSWVEKSRKAIAPASGSGLEVTLLSEGDIWKKNWMCRRYPQGQTGAHITSPSAILMTQGTFRRNWRLHHRVAPMQPRPRRSGGRWVGAGRTHTHQVSLHTCEHPRTATALLPSGLTQPKTRTMHGRESWEM